MTSNVITLDFINEAAEKEFGSLTVATPQGDVRLRNPLRLDKDTRARLKAAQEAGRETRAIRKAAADEYKAAVEAAGEDEAALAAIPEPEAIDTDAQFAEVAGLLEILADNPDRARALTGALNGDIALISTVMRLYNEAVQPGEA